MVKSPRVTLPSGVEESFPVMVEEIRHHVHFSVDPTRIAAQANAGAEGFFGSSEQLLIFAVGSFIAERSPINSCPVGTRA